MTFADGCGQRTLEGNVVSCDGVDRLVWNGGLAVLQDWGNIDWFPLDGDVRGAVDVFDGLRDLGSNTITLDERYCVLSLSVAVT